MKLIYAILRNLENKLNIQNKTIKTKRNIRYEINKQINDQTENSSVAI